VSEQRRGGNYGGKGGGGGQRGAEHSVDAAEADIFRGHALVDGGALLKKKHPGRDGCADVGEDEEQSVFVETGERMPGDEGMTDRVPTGMGHESDRNKN
jgi:hypothetical protein